MSLELHRQDQAEDLTVRVVKVFPRWLTAEQYQEIRTSEATILAESLIKTLPPETTSELTRLLAEHATKKPT